MGVINITPDSFSDGGLYLDPDDACKRASLCLEKGASVLDLGAQSTRPGANYVDVKTELKRLLPSLKVIRENFPDAIISVDTFNSIVAEKALEVGANWINDISGGRMDKNMYDVISGSNCPFVITHSRGDSRTMNNYARYNDVVFDVYQELLELTQNALDKGVNSNQIIWDPGLGFAKNNDDNIKLVKNLDYFTNKKFPILLGPSRKKFIGYFLKEDDPNKRLIGTAAVVCKCVQAKVDIVRVHDVNEISRVINISEQIW